MVSKHAAQRGVRVNNMTKQQRPPITPRACCAHKPKKGNTSRVKYNVNYDQPK